MQYIKTQFLMGTDVTITINSTKNPIDDIYDSFGIFYSLEQEFSRFLINSELSLLNINREMEVSDRFVEILKLCIDVYNKTFCFFNPLVNVSDL
jgi:thiamine biosynthesis lipoprotein ApbE